MEGFATVNDPGHLRRGASGLVGWLGGLRSGARAGDMHADVVVYQEVCAVYTPEMDIRFCSERKALGGRKECEEKRGKRVKTYRR